MYSETWAQVLVYHGSHVEVREQLLVILWMVRFWNNSLTQKQHKFMTIMASFLTCDPFHLIRKIYTTLVCVCISYVYIHTCLYVYILDIG